MPEISRFYGIIIRIFYNDHNPPHFHAEYQDFEVLVSVQPIRIIDGDAPARVKSMIIEWAGLHQLELIQAWRDAQAKNPPRKIEPLV